VEKSCLGIVGPRHEVSAGLVHPMYGCFYERLAAGSLAQSSNYVKRSRRETHCKVKHLPQAWTLGFLHISVKNFRFSAS